MDMKAIRALAEIMKANDLTQVEITEEGKTIRMKREIAAVPVPAQTPFAPVMPAPAAVPVSEVFHETPQQGVVIESPMDVLRIANARCRTFCENWQLCKKR